VQLNLVNTVGGGGSLGVCLVVGARALGGLLVVPPVGGGGSGQRYNTFKIWSEVLTGSVNCG
jgi:hypothetical protein